MTTQSIEEEIEKELHIKTLSTGIRFFDPGDNSCCSIPEPVYQALISSRQRVKELEVQCDAFKATMANNEMVANIRITELEAEKAQRDLVIEDLKRQLKEFETEVMNLRKENG